MSGSFIATGTCWSHGDVFEFDPDHVCTIMIDPETNDVPAPGRMGAARQVTICDPCVQKANVIRVARDEPPHETAAEHQRRLGPENWV